LKERDFMLMGSPMTAETRNDVFGSAYNVQEHTPMNFEPHPSVPAGGTNFMDDVLDDWNPATGAITPGEGFVVYPQAAYIDPAYAGPPPVTTIQFPLTYSEGTLNTGNVDRNIIFRDLTVNPDGTPNFLANPYASPIDASMLVANNALINEIYFWEHLTPPSAAIPGANVINVSMDDLSIYNGTMGIPAANDPGTSTAPNGVISTGQGFGIKAFGSGTVTFTNSMRLTTGNITLRTPEGLEKLLLKVESDQYQARSYTGIGFRGDATPQLDEGMDSNRLATLIALYSHLEDGSEQLGIQTRESFESGIKIPMGFASQIEEDTTYKISIVDVTGSNLTVSNIYLVDHLTGMITDLTQNDYEFSSDTGTFNGRFTLQFETEVLANGDLALNSISLYPNPADALLNVVSPNAEITGIRIHDVLGRKVEDISVNSERSYQVDISSLDTALYFVTVTTESGSVTKRIVKK
ncbi:T9SS type A sorting domain-containing protein, partial [Aureitalea sp. L0-47]|uniref:T9SS type A sorting domain-containing protein n=1 Tax=Aureitalea sp. L0-47 TaxID=2816962 RepID=UPI0022384B22